MLLKLRNSQPESKPLGRQIGNNRVQHRKTGQGDAQPARIRRFDQAVLVQHGDARRVERPAGERLKTRNIDAFGEPQPHQQELVGHVLTRQRVVGGEAMTGGLDAHEPRLRPFFRRRRMPVALDVEPAVSARSDAGVFLGAPVDEVMPAFAAGPGVIGNLVGRQAVRRANLQGGVVKLAAEIVVGNDELARGMERGKRRVLLDGQLIEREMVAGLGQGACELAAQSFGSWRGRA